MSKKWKRKRRRSGQNPRDCSCYQERWVGGSPSSSSSLEQSLESIAYHDGWQASGSWAWSHIATIGLSQASKRKSTRTKSKEAYECRTHTNDAVYNFAYDLRVESITVRNCESWWCYGMDGEDFIAFVGLRRTLSGPSCDIDVKRLQKGDDKSVLNASEISLTILEILSVSSF